MVIQSVIDTRTHTHTHMFTDHNFYTIIRIGYEFHLGTAGWTSVVPKSDPQNGRFLPFPKNPKCTQVWHCSPRLGESSPTGHGSKSRTPSKKSQSPTNIGSKMGGEFTYQPKWDPIGVDPQPPLAQVPRLFAGRSRASCSASVSLAMAMSWLLLRQLGTSGPDI